MPAAYAARPPLPRDSAPVSRGVARPPPPRAAGGGVPLPSRARRGRRDRDVIAAPPPAGPARGAFPVPAAAKAEPPVRAKMREHSGGALVWSRARTPTL
eukprot:2621239-Rhodomonas_salina.1